MTFGERIVYFREKRNLSQKALADILGITANRLYYYEKDKRQPDVAMIKDIAKALSISGDDLLGTEWATEKTPGQDAPETVCATPEERELLSLYNQMNDDGKKLLLSTARTYAGNPAMQKESSCEEAI